MRGITRHHEKRQQFYIFDRVWREIRHPTHLQTDHRLNEATPVFTEGEPAAWARLCEIPKRAAF